MVKLRYSKGEKKPLNLTVDMGIVKKAKKLLEKENISLSSHVERLLDDWCYDQDDQNTFQKILEETMKDLPKKKFSWRGDEQWPNEGSDFKVDPKKVEAFKEKLKKLIQENKTKGGKS